MWVERWENGHGAPVSMSRERQRPPLLLAAADSKEKSSRGPHCCCCMYSKMEDATAHTRPFGQNPVSIPLLTTTALEAARARI